MLVFRENLRAAVLRFESGRSPDRHFLSELNRKLLDYPSRYVLRDSAHAVHRELFLEPQVPEDLWAPIAEAAAALFAEVPFSRVRQCEGCIVHFHDISKKGSRRWCSMSLCGNREKVATYRQRRRNLA